MFLFLLQFTIKVITWKSFYLKFCWSGNAVAKQDNKTTHRLYHMFHSNCRLYFYATSKIGSKQDNILKRFSREYVFVHHIYLGISKAFGVNWVKLSHFKFAAFNVWKFFAVTHKFILTTTDQPKCRWLLSFAFSSKKTCPCVAWILLILLCCKFVCCCRSGQTRHLFIWSKTFNQPG